MRSAELCAGYGGLALAVEEVFGSETAWFSEFESAPSKILAHHWPHVPNHGDMTKIDWAAVEPVDIIAGGTPCQDLSGAGKRAGMSEGTRSNLWVQMREAVAIIKPKYVVWENVRGAYSASAFSELESREGRVGGAGGGGPVLRALGRVLGDLSDLGYDCQWRGLRAADVGAPHGRFRVFVLAELTDADHQGSQGQRDSDGASQAQRHGHASAGTDGGTADPTGNGWDQGRAESTRLEGRHDAPLSSDSSTPDASGSTVREHSGESSAEETGPGSSDRSGDPRGEQHAGERREATADADSGNDDGRIQNQIGEPLERDASAGGSGVNWGEYEPAIRRWEQVLERSAPAPTEPTGRNGSHRLSARFAEFMMGVPDGWIVDVPGVSRNEALKAAGNGVVVAQAVAALQDMLRADEALKQGGAA